MKVVKFGGSSLASGNSVDKALSIINADPERQVVVVSAPGKRTEDDINEKLDNIFAFQNAMTNYPYVIYYGSLLSEDIEEGINRARNLFFKGDYTSSLKVSVDTIKLVDDNFERKLLAYEKE